MNESSLVATSYLRDVVAAALHQHFRSVSPPGDGGGVGRSELQFCGVVLGGVGTGVGGGL